MLPTIISLILKTLAPKAKAFEAATKDPLEHQKKLLSELLSRNSRTEYGLRYNFSKIKSIKDYQDSVPLTSCETMYPYISRMARGENNILTSDKVIFFGMTSGTTSHPKLIPVTKFSRDRKAALMNIWAYYIYRDHPNVIKGKILAIISTEIEGHTESGIPYGAESGHAYRNLPWIIKNLYVLPPGIFDIKDYESRYYCMLRIGIEKDVTILATLNPSTIIILCQKLERWKNSIIADIKNGTLDKKLDIPEDIRTSIEKTLRPNPKKARELEGRFLPKDFWPNLELIECWKGGTVKLYLKELPQYFADVAVRDFGCLSTEARSSIPMTDEGAGGVLAVKTNFYEFLPKEDMKKTDKRFLLSDELEVGKEYFLIVTTPGGLYRYDIDDIIRVDGFFNKTPVIEFIQKGSNAISITGEKVYESHVNEAVNLAAEKHRLLIDFFSATIELARPPHYVFLVEFGSLPTRRDQKKELLGAIEEELYRQNAEYRNIRKEGLLGPPVLKVVRKGEFERYRAKKIEEGSHDTQFKAPELTPDLDFQKNFTIEEEIRLN